ncbi:type VI secretion system Vgr family protein [Sorangium cellulosum]|uniref:type VI secretion system Vgr family protein n=1 Tax=Sorangium cellulosum TaxID=56 RepID=UPI0009D766B2|nr:type VI secretion system tip protein TssI/VgrG [Sorangium cellulosum]
MPNQLALGLSCSGLEGDLIFTSATVLEALSRPTRASVHALSRDDIDGARAIGQPAHLIIQVDGTPARHFHLVVIGLRFDGIHRDGLRRYVISLAHELWLLGLRADIRMFQDKDAKEIVAAVLDGAGISPDHLSFSLERAPVRRAYCVQHAETDLAFASRLLEHEGIFYVVEDDESSTHVTFADSHAAFSPIDGASPVRILDVETHGKGVHELVLETRAAPGRVSLCDYNFETPGIDLTVSVPAAASGFGDQLLYPAGFLKQADGQALAAIRAEEARAHQTVGRGRSDVLEFQAGRTFSLENAARDPLAQEYLLTSVEHRVVVQPLDPTVHLEPYANVFLCTPLATRHRPQRTTPRPRIRGAHSAVVTGSAGGEIHTDKLGRLKSKFFWDRIGNDDDTSSCWIRLAQHPISGSMTLARVGWEMTVVYFDGDPDRPIAVSRMYNAEKVSPYSYPAAATRSALQTSSSPGGAKRNEIRMEDGGGGMEMFVNAARDFDAVTNNNKTEAVGVNEERTVGADEQVTIGSNQAVTIGADATTTVSADAGVRVGGDRTKSVGASETVTVGGDVSVNVTGSDAELTGGSHTTAALLSISRTATGSHGLAVGGSMLSAAGLGVSMAVAGAKSETVGGAKISASAAGVTESFVGALASTVGGVRVQAAGGDRVGTSKGLSVVTVGGLMVGNAAGQVTIKGKKVGIRVLGIANFLGGGGILNLTAGSAAFVGLVTLDASGGITFSGNPNLVG